MAISALGYLTFGELLWNYVIYLLKLQPCWYLAPPSWYRFGAKRKHIIKF